MPDDLPDLRASHEDRDRVVDTLRVAGGDGRRIAEELDARLECALSARTLGELAELTADLPGAPAARDVLVVEQHGGKYVKEGRWLVPARIALRMRECRVTLDFTDAVITSRALRIDADMVHGKLFIVSSPGIVINTDGLTCTYSKLKLHSTDEAADSRLRVEFVGRLLHEDHRAAAATLAGGALNSSLGPARLARDPAPLDDLASCSAHHPGRQARHSGGCAAA